VTGRIMIKPSATMWLRSEYWRCAQPAEKAFQLFAPLNGLEDAF
jgi:hypothetical protein